MQSRLEESSRRRGNRHRIALETTELSPEASEVLQQVHDPLLLALTELLVLPIPDVLCILCRREKAAETQAVSAIPGSDGQLLLWNLCAPHTTEWEFM